jgi:hypothetical protein
MTGKYIRKRLSVPAHAAVLKRIAERDQHLLLVEALNQSIERVIEQDTGVNLDKQNWELDLANGCITRIREVADGQPG